MQRTRVPSDRNTCESCPPTLPASVGRSRSNRRVSPPPLPTEGSRSGSELANPLAGRAITPRTIRGGRDLTAGGSPSPFGGTPAVFEERTGGWSPLDGLQLPVRH